LDFLGFIRPNPDFSMGYEQKNKKKSTRVSSCVQSVSSDSHLFSLPSLAQGAALSSDLEKDITPISDFSKKKLSFSDSNTNSDHSSRQGASRRRLKDGPAGLVNGPDMGYVRAIEFRPNDLASARPPRRTDHLLPRSRSL
jgi:hypothetical protein